MAPTAAPLAPAAPRPAGVALAGYLAVTAAPLVAGGLAGGRWVVLLAHLSALALVVAAELSVARGTAGRWTRGVADLNVLLLLPALYAELPFLMEGMPGPVVFRDPAVQAVELGLFGFHPAWELAGRWPALWLSELLHACYLLYYPIIYVPPLLLYARVLRGGGRETARAFEDTVAALALAVLGSFVVMVAWPVQGPRYLAPPAGVPDGPVRGLVLAVLESGSSRGAAFPSSHVSVAVAQTLLAVRHQPRVGRLLVPVTSLLALGAVYGGFHYAVDALAGAGVGAAAAWLSAPLRRALGGPDAGFTPGSRAV